ncbi:MAG: Mut7-C ubiquitin/RNAse domain-containing protein [Ignavibacteria bacterium]|nr:Mut7-C ubiquitin/RNAse domain-containing protein [Ignavibacteria bacterium]
MKYLNTAKFRFYHNLNDFLPEKRRRVVFEVEFIGNPAIKDTIESLNVPHTEVDLLIVNGNPVNFNYKLKDGDSISIYPEFKSLELPQEMHLKKKIDGVPKFICDVQLGKLAKYLRILGFDTLYDNNYKPEDIIKLSLDDNRIILTRSITLLKNHRISIGYWVRSENPVEQLIQILSQLELIELITPFNRCSVCNGELETADKKLIENDLLNDTKKYFDEFFLCSNCKKVYWKGSHFKRINEFIQGIRKSI